jgi:hypothetical protein
MSRWHAEPATKPVERRDFLRWAGAAALAGVGGARAEAPARIVPETFAQELFATLAPAQKSAVAFPWDHPLRAKAFANWAITKPKIGDFGKVQQDLVDKILRGMTSEAGYRQFIKQMADDDGGIGNYHFAFFGQPGTPQFDYVMTGRHMTMRCDGNAADGIAWGGPMVYGHQGETDIETAGHPGNVFWQQGRRANEVFRALDGQQRQQAMVARAPKQNAVAFRKGDYPGLPVAAMSADQQRLVEAVVRDLLAPYRPQDADEAMKVLAANGGVGKLHLAYYRKDEEDLNADLGNDGVWDLWRLEGPGFVWHFRGFPHIHVWVNVARA